jgi:cell division protein ZapD
VTNTITYEFPLSERIRVFIRLEQLFQQFSYFSAGETVADNRAVISTLLDITLILRRNDLKSEILKELERHTKVLNKIADNQGVDPIKLEKILKLLSQTSKNLYATSGKIGMAVLENELLQSIAQRSSIPGGTCSFDLPEYHYWLEQDSSSKLKDLENWSNSYADIRTAIELILSFIRQSNIPTEETAIAGFFQITLDKSQPYQLIKVSLDKSLDCFAEISGGKHRCTIRFMSPGTNDTRPAQTSKDIPFALTCCLF